MIGIIKNDFYKIYKSYGIYVLLIIFNILALVFLKFLSQNTELLSSPVTFLNMANYSLIVWIIFYFSTYISDEYKNGTLKLSLINSITRTEFLLGKFITFIINLFIIATVNLIVGYISALIIVHGSLTGIGNLIGYNYLSLISAIGLGAVGLIISVIVNSASNVVYIFIGLFILAKLFAAKTGIYNIVNDLSLTSLLHNESKLIIISIAYIIIGFIISCIYFKYKDIKY